MKTRIQPVLILLPLIAFLTSCAMKHYTISEKSAFRATRYDMEKDKEELALYPENEKQLWLNIASAIIDSAQKNIITSDSINITRNFIPVNDSIFLEYFKYIPEKFDKTIYFFIGNESRQTSYVEYLIQLAIKSKSIVYALNYRGYGYSNGIPSFRTQFDDNQKYFNNLENKNTTGHTIIIGYSLGSGFAMDLAASNPCDKLVLLAPFSDTKDMLKHYKKLFLSGIKAPLRPFISLTAADYLLNISNINKVELYKNDLLIMHARDDEELPYKMGVKVFENSVSANKRFVTLKKGGHSAPFEPENWNRMIRWILN